MKTLLQNHFGTATYTLRLASSPSDLHAVQSLRFDVFNLELHEGLAKSYLTCRDADPFDAVCDHLIVEETGTGLVVGTYRMQTGARAAQSLGYYCEQEFDFSPFEALRGELLELGRACIAQEHRCVQVLSLLWRGIASYAQQHGARYLMGCSSLTTQDPATGHAAYAALKCHLAPPYLRTVPLPEFCLEPAPEPAPRVKIPKLLSAYLGLGAWICSPAAIDRSFGTIDFLTCLDLQSPPMAQRRKRFGITE